MVFTSHIFVFYFLPAVLAVYYLLPGRTPHVRNVFLLVASYSFYGWWNPWFVFLMFFATAVNYACGEVISRAGVGAHARPAALAASVVISLGTLGFFKYFVFLQDNVNSLVTLLGVSASPVWQVVLPVGISFYIFQSLSYTIDVYRGTSPPVRSFFDFACFVSLFPQLIAGPIVRYNTIADQLVSRRYTLDTFGSGVALFILGFAKKILVANAVGTLADAAFEAESLGAADAWFGVTAYAFQIYFDFSGYSDMAIGLGRMLGFEFLPNFNAPYLAESITDFWRRWHISLSTFLRDYLYIALGGNRKGARRTYANLAVVMLLGGLWHGANWTFVLWGAYHGALLAFERRLGKRSLYAGLPRPFRVALTFVLVLFAWVLFRSPDLGAATDYFRSMVGFGHTTGASPLLAGLLYTREGLTMMVVAGLLVLQPIQAGQVAARLTVPKVLLLVVLFALSLMAMFTQAFNPFLYFQF